MDAVDLITRFEGVRQTGRDRWIARCPAHGDKRASLSIRGLDDGRTLIHCFAGCHVDAILGAVGLSVSELFPPRPETYERTSSKRGLHPTDALACIAHEARLVLIAGRSIEAGQRLSPPDLERVSLAAARIAAALDVAHV